MAEEFEIQIENFRRKTTGENGSAARVVRGIATEILRRVVYKTPVDTGRARGNWQVALGTVKISEIDRLDPSGSAAIVEGIGVIHRAKAPYDIVIANNLPYIIPLEYGHSGQAPQGMVRVTLVEMQSIIGDVVRRENR